MAAITIPEDCQEILRNSALALMRQAAREFDQQAEHPEGDIDTPLAHFDALRPLLTELENGRVDGQDRNGLLEILHRAVRAEATEVKEVVEDSDWAAAFDVASRAARLSLLIGVVEGQQWAAHPRPR